MTHGVGGFSFYAVIFSSGFHCQGDFVVQRVLEPQLSTLIQLSTPSCKLQEGKIRAHLANHFPLHSRPVSSAQRSAYTSLSKLIPLTARGAQEYSLWSGKLIVPARQQDSVKKREGNNKHCSGRIMLCTPV